MRIVGGRWKGRALSPVGKGDESARLRPTTDRVRESLFNLLEHGAYPALHGASVLDLFAGTGALGLEALSRGANRAVFVETGRAGLGILQKNLKLLGVENATILREDATKLRACKAQPVDFLFADPPYGRGLGLLALQRATAGGWLAKGAVVVLEDNVAIAPPEGFEEADRRSYGDATLTILRRLKR